MLHVPNRGRGGFPLLADSEESKQQWMTSLTQAIEKATETLDQVFQSVAPSSYEDDSVSINASDE